MEGQETEISLLKKQMEEMRIALSHPEVQKILHTLEKGKGKMDELEPGEIPRASTSQGPLFVQQPQVDTQAQAPEEQAPTPHSPHYSFMEGLEDIVPEEDMALESEEEPQQEVQSRRKIPLDKRSKWIKKRSTNKKKRVFKSGDKDVKFNAYNGRRDNDKALAFIH